MQIKGTKPKLLILFYLSALLLMSPGLLYLTPLLSSHNPFLPCKNQPLILTIYFLLKKELFFLPTLQFIFLQMSQITISSPKHCAKKGLNFNFLNKKLFKILTTLTLSILSLILLFWFILHPSKPQFILQEIDVYKLNFSSPHLLNSSIEITLEARNPNQKVGIYYDELQAHASYKGQQITLQTSVPGFYQEQQDSNLISASLVGNGLPVAPSLGYELGRDQAAGMMALVLKIDGRLRWKVGTWVSGRYRINVKCVTILPLTPFSPSGYLNSKQGTQCSTNI